MRYGRWSRGRKKLALLLSPVVPFCCQAMPEAETARHSSLFNPIAKNAFVFLNTLSVHRERSTRCRTQLPLSQDGEWATVSYGCKV